MMSQTLSSWAQKDLYSLCKQIFSQMTMGIESKDFIFGLIPQRISISMESYGTIAKQCKLIQYEGFHQFLFFLLILSGLHISVFFVIYVIISCYTTISICERIVLGNLILARYLIGFSGFLWTTSLLECSRTIQGWEQGTLHKRCLWREAYGMENLGHQVGKRLNGLKHHSKHTTKNLIYMVVHLEPIALLNLNSTGGIQRSSMN